MERWVAKVIALIGIFLVMLISSLLPIKVSGYFIQKGEKGKYVISCMSIFGGGVFFATYLLHMAPEVRELLEHTLLEPNEIDYPIPELIIAGGFILVLLMEKLIYSYIANKQNKVSSNDIELLGVSARVRTYSLAVEEEHAQKEDVQMEKEAIPVNGDVQYQLGESEVDASQLQENNKVTIASTNHVASNKEQTQSSPESQGDLAHGSKSIILLLALSLHTVFEGMSVGLQRDIAGVVSLFIAIISHEWVIAFSLGLQLVKDHDKTSRVVASALAYSLTTPVGVAIGTAIMETSGIAAGTFLYVTFFEVLQSEIDQNSTWVQILCLMLGVAFMAALGLLEGDGGGGDSGGNTTTSLVYR